MTTPTYNELLIELVATLDALVENARTEWVRDSARERRKMFIKLPGEKKQSKIK